MKATLVAELNRLVLRVTGQLNFADNEVWRTQVESMLEKESASYVLDITALEMVDSAGLGMMLAMKSWAEDKGRQVMLRFDPLSMVGGMIRLAKFNEMFEVDVS